MKTSELLRNATIGDLNISDLEQLAKAQTPKEVLRVLELSASRIAIMGK